MISHEEMKHRPDLGDGSPPLTLGERRVRTTFNPSANSTVDQIKQKTAELIDLCETLRPSAAVPGADNGRLIALAQTGYEEAAMCAVRAATAGK